MADLQKDQGAAPGIQLPELPDPVQWPEVTASDFPGLLRKGLRSLGLELARLRHRERVLQPAPLEEEEAEVRDAWAARTS